MLLASSPRILSTSWDLTKKTLFSLLSHLHPQRTILPFLLLTSPPLHPTILLLISDSHGMANEEKTFPCNACPKQFEKLGDIAKHHSSTHRQLPFLCGRCGQCFVSKGEIDKHAEEPHCGKCGKHFRTKSDLLPHVRIPHPQPARRRQRRR
ncbi:unnamed protein product [Linum tenue]|uniref:C2H2-type domain-containing protein n=1 Tax=Linum tenue TaxID=586396 RepID=A0AAV0H9T4_9ROSI|nr:unnamed protein product [Linum tenue]